MAEFYEFHDAHLEQIEHRGQKVILKMQAYKHVWPDGYDVNSGTGWMQQIEITIEGAEPEFEFSSFPVDIYDGKLKATSILATPEDIQGDMIPASLSGAVDVEIYMEGYEELTDEYKGMRIRGISAAITHKGDVRFIEKLPWWKKNGENASQPKMIGVGEFDSGIPDLATNKKHMEGFGEWKR